jgi:mono/diheme cytochrome c family protein
MRAERLRIGLMWLSGLLVVAAAFHRPPGVAELADRAAAGDVARGRSLWQRECCGCHGDIPGCFGPPLAFTLAAMLREQGPSFTRRYVVESIVQPEKVVRRQVQPMPWINLSDRNIVDVTAFVVDELVDR